MTRATLLLPKGIEELIASCWVLKGKCTFFSHKRKLQIRLLLLTDTDVSTTVSVCYAGGHGQLHSPPKPNLWDRIMQVMMPINQRAAASISEERCYLNILPFDHKTSFSASSSPPSLFCNPFKTSYLLRITITHCYHQACTDLFAHDHCSNG